MNITSNWWWQDFENVSSTNDIAYEFSFNPPATQYVISAKTQTSGRGRRGRVWQSLDGNLFFSIALKEQEKLINYLPFICSLALKDTILSLNKAVNIKLKWPNDVLLDGAKVSGILLEKGANDYMIIGVGVNLVVTPDEEDIMYQVTSLKDYINIDRCEFLQRFLHFFDTLLLIWQQHGADNICHLWKDSAIGIGHPIIVKGENSYQEGLFVDIDNDGGLLLAKDDKISKIYAGDVFIKTESK